MRELVYFVATSLDGRITGPGGDVTGYVQTPAALAALARDFPETFPAHVHAPLGITDPRGRFDTVLMGRSTYAPALEAGITSPYPHLEQWVFSRTLDPSAYAGVHVTPEDPGTVVDHLRGRPGGDLWLCGGGALAAALIDRVDRLLLKTSPFVAGDGVPLVQGGGPVGFAHVGSTPYPDGLVLHEYARA